MAEGGADRDPRSGGDRGFTLLEVLISLVLLGVLLAALGQGFRFGLSAWEIQDKQMARVEALDATDRSLRLLITTMSPGTMFQPGLHGSSDRMTFVGTLPSALGQAVRADMTLLATSDGQLILRWRVHRHEKRLVPPPPETETVFLSGVRRLDIAYWRAAAPGIAGGWAPEWSQPGLPTLIRLRIAFKDGDPRHWPDIVIAPALETLMP